MNAPLMSPAPTNPIASPLIVDTRLVRKYGGNGPRYTSYPTADRFIEAFGESRYRYWLGHRATGGFTRPLGLYVHIPFCDTLCFYCACNKIATRNHAKADTYLGYLDREIAMASGALVGSRRISKMHWGGGTPTFLGAAGAERLMRALRSRFDFDPRGEYAIEVDPRKVDAEGIAHLGAIGFNRMSVGVQDFDRDVQRAVNRIQSVEQTRTVIDAARANGFRSVNVDLIYGLPKQTVPGFLRSLERVIECDPDRIALYGYAHLPAMFAPQRKIIPIDLPLPETKLQLMTSAIERLGEAGYVYIGMDHFAKPTDELAVAQRQGRLIRDFQGYSCGGEADLIALGVSAISNVGPSYSQNVKDLDGYYARIDQGELPVLRGIELTQDDLVRRAVIQALACHFSVSKESIGIAYLVDFDRYFAREMKDLQALVDDGLVELEPDWIHVTPRGRLLVRAVCMVFDRYLREAQTRASYSRVM
jgi:oxygen-independent coproporphyrinogen-3 oxidase